MAVVTTGSATKSYRALNYYVSKTTNTWHMDFIIIYDLEISLKVCLLFSIFSCKNKNDSCYHCDFFVADIECKQALP